MARMLMLRALRRLVRDPAQARRLGSGMAAFREGRAGTQDMYTRAELLRRWASLGAAHTLVAPVALPRNPAMGLNPLVGIAGGTVARNPNSVSTANSLGLSQFTWHPPLRIPKRLSVSGSTPIGEFKLDLASS